MAGTCLSICPHPCARPVLFFANGVGDAIMSLPALRSIAQSLAGQAFLVTGIGLHEMLFRELPIRGYLEVEMWRDSEGRQFSPASISRTIGSCDLFLAPVPWISASLTALIASLEPKHSIGFFPTYGTHIPLDYTKHSSALAFEVALALNPKAAFDLFTEPPRLPQRAIERAFSFIKLVPRAMKVIVVHNETQAAKQWSARSMQVALDSFLAERNDFMVFIVSAMKQVVPKSKHADRISYLHGLQCSVAMAVVGQADMFLGADSCMLHVADFFRIPSVGLFGPTDPIEFGFRLAPHKHVSAHKMSDITPERVVIALHEMADNIKPRNQGS
jgi:ADP-heptose:LPS heptosyltransferase